MSEKVSVSISATAFSLLLYENTKAKENQEGFLLGEIITNRKRTITDNDQAVISIEHIIKVNSVIPWPWPSYFYNSYGSIDHTKIEEFLGPKHDSVICWYKFKHASSFTMMLRDKILMKQFANYFQPLKPEMFLCALLTAHLASDIGSTHVFSQTFIRYHKSIYERIPMHIVNLGDAAGAYSNTEESSNMFRKLIKDYKIKIDNDNGYSVITQVELAYDTRLAELVQELSQQEAHVFKLEQEVEELRMNRLLNRMEKKAEHDEDIEMATSSRDSSISISDCVPEDENNSNSATRKTPKMKARQKRESQTPVSPVIEDQEGRRNTRAKKNLK